MNKKSIISILIWIVAVILVCSFIAALVYYRIFPKSISSVTIKACIGLIILIVDTFCAWGVIRPIISKYIDVHGSSTTGVIENVAVLTRPDQLRVDEWIKQSRYSFTISYKVNQKRYTKEFPPTILTSKCELYPQSINKGDSVGLKYLKEWEPNWAVLIAGATLSIVPIVIVFLVFQKYFMSTNLNSGFGGN